MMNFVVCEQKVYADDAVYDIAAGAYNDPDKEVTSINEDGTIVDETEITTSIETENDIDHKNQGISYKAANDLTSQSTAVVNFKTKSSSSQNTEYVECDTKRPGYVNGYYAADAAFLGFDNDQNPTKVKFLQAGVIGWVSYSEVAVYNYSDSRVNTTSKYYVSGGRLYHGIVTDLGKDSYSSSLDCGPKPDYLQEGKTYFSYDGHYFYTYDTNDLTNAYATMLNDYRNNVRTHAINANDPYYNYYMYLSHRSITEYTASELNKAIANFSKSTSKMLNLGQSFIDNQNLYGVNALLMIGVAANESAWGSSNIAMTKNNLFGHAAYDSDPNGSSNGYSSPAYSIYYHAAKFVSKGYCDCITDWKYYGSFLGDKASGMAVKYASDPYWGEKAAAMAWKVDSYLGGKDAKKYTIAIKDTLPSQHSIIDVKVSPSSSSTTLYKTYPISSTTTYKAYAPSNFAFIVLKNGQTNGYYKIQCDSEVNSSRTAIVNQEAYTFANSYGYIPVNSVKIVSNGSNSTSEVDKNTSNITGESTGKGDGEPTLYYQSNVESYGWLDEVNEPNTTGTTGQVLDLYQLKIRIENNVNNAVLSGKVYANGKWTTYSKISNSTVIGTDKKSIEKVSFSLTGEPRYKLQYRVHSADVGWQSWVDAGTETGTSGKSIQAIDFRLVEDTTKPILYYQSNVQSKGWMSEVRDPNTTGTTGQALNLYQLKMRIENNVNNAVLSGKVYANGKWTTYSNIKENTVIGNENVPIQLVNFNLSGLTGYKLQYQVHCADYGWLDWVDAGTETGKSGKNIQAINFRLIVTDEKPIVSVSLNKTTLTLSKGTSEVLQATINPNDTTDSKTIKWTSSNNSVATVDQSGKITAVNTGKTTITATTSNGKTASCVVSVSSSKPTLSYETHVQDYGWRASVEEGQTAGTTGLAKKIEAIKITFNNNSYSGNIEYRTHIQDYGWETSWQTSGGISGTTGKNKRLEAIQIRLTGDIAEQYDIYYRVHAQEFGWLDWAKNGQSAGTAGYCYRLEAIEIKLVEKGKSAPGATDHYYQQKEYIGYTAHVQDLGWQKTVYDGAVGGTTGKVKALEAIQIALKNPQYDGDVIYKAHVQDYGWEANWSRNGATSGTTGKVKSMEAIQIQLTGEMGQQFDVYYRAHVEDYGWLDWAKNGQSAGTEGLSKHLEAVEIILVKKGESFSGSTTRPFIKK